MSSSEYVAQEDVMKMRAQLKKTQKAKERKENQETACCCLWCCLEMMGCGCLYDCGECCCACRDICCCCCDVQKDMDEDERVNDLIKSTAPKTTTATR